MPFCHARLQTLKPKPPKYPKELKTLGDHIRKRRLDQGLLQREVAEEIGVTASTVWRWERNETNPPVRFMPRIIKFLGYGPIPLSKSIPEGLLAARKTLGLTQKEMAKRLGVDPTTLAKWEREKMVPERSS